MKTKGFRIRTNHDETYTPLDSELNRQIEIYISNNRTRIKRAEARTEAVRSKNRTRDNNNSAPLFDDSLSQSETNK